MVEEGIGKCLRQVQHIRGHLWHIHSITVNQYRYPVWSSQRLYRVCVNCTHSKHSVLMSNITIWSEEQVCSQTLYRQCIYVSVSRCAHPRDLVRISRTLVLCVCFIDRCLSFCTYFLSMCCLFFFDLWQRLYRVCVNCTHSKHSVLMSNITIWSEEQVCSQKLYRQCIYVSVI
jgi:hypothetical protein